MIYDNDKEQKQHADAIQAIAQQYGVNESTVKEIYELELARLKSNARIKTYLSVLATRLVREAVLKTDHFKNINSKKPTPLDA